MEAGEEPFEDTDGAKGMSALAGIKGIGMRHDFIAAGRLVRRTEKKSDMTLTVHK